jgi:hypothetical protein
MRRPNDLDSPTEDERLHETAQILAAGVLRLRQRAALLTPAAHVSASEIPPDSSIHVLEPGPQPSLIH